MPVYQRHGDFRRTVTIQRRTNTTSAGGQQKATWTDALTLKAAAEPGRAREFYAGAGVIAESPMLFRVRWRDDIDSTVRVVYRGVTYAVDGVEDFNGAHVETHIYARAGVNAG